MRFCGTNVGVETLNSCYFIEVLLQDSKFILKVVDILLKHDGCVNFGGDSSPNWFSFQIIAESSVLLNLERVRIVPENSLAILFSVREESAIFSGFVFYFVDFMSNNDYL